MHSTTLLMDCHFIAAIAKLHNILEMLRNIAIEMCIVYYD